MTTTPDRILLNNAQAAELLSISPKTLVNMRLAGEIPYVKLWDDRTKGIRYSLDALKAWVAERQQSNERPSPKKAGNQ